MSDYLEEKKAAEKRDRELGFAIEETEARIQFRGAGQTWSHLSPQVFQTPYAELERIIEDVDPARSLPIWVDLGAAYGRLGIVLGELRPNARFVGVELVAERVEEGRRVFRSLGLDPESLRAGDLGEIPLPEGNLYFIYDFGTRPELERVVLGLREIALTRSIIVVGRGRGIRDVIERDHPWLSSVIRPEHFPHYSIYRSSE
jgi:hypothetical protein